MGSTVILLFGPGHAAWVPERQDGGAIRMGEALGQVNRVAE
jgi:hypothetical protein